MYRCNDCGNEFDKPHAVEESRGEFWGMPCSETMYYCPYCDSDDFDIIDESDFEEEEEDSEELKENEYFQSLGVWDKE